MLLKEPGNFEIHRFWEIHLYKHDYNLLLTIKWRHLIHHCTLHSLLHPVQYGGLPGENAVRPTIIEELQYEISQASHHPLVHTGYGEASCCDRITLNLVSLACRAHRQHKAITQINATTLQEVKFVLKTQLGTSEQHYSHSNLQPSMESDKVQETPTQYG